MTITSANLKNSKNLNPVGMTATGWTGSLNMTYNLNDKDQLTRRTESKI